MSQTFVSLDLETTGLDPRSDEIIEIGAVKFRGEEVVDTFHTLVKPYRLLPYRIQVLTGITQAEVDAAPPLPVVVEELLSFLAHHPIVGQNIAFDLEFLSQKGISLPNPIYDTFELATILLPTLSDYSLAAVAESLGLTALPRHRALPDAMAAKEAFLALWDRARGLDVAIVAEMVRLTRDRDLSLAPLFRHIWEERGLPVEGEFDVPRHAEKRKGRLVAATARKPLDVKGLTQMLEMEGPLAKAFPGFEHRAEQVEMMQAMAQALNQGQRLIVEAGTGTGKSIAYLLPTIFFAMENGLPVVISTNTINLQEQLMGKDIPDLKQALKLEGLRYCQLKGRNNYLCLRRWNLLRRSQNLSVEEVRFLLRTLVWLSRTKSGDRAELGTRDAGPWNRVCAQGGGCLGAQCSYQQRGSCFLHRARREAEGTHLIVVNHALLLSDIASGSKVLPPYSHLIVDEAHHLEEEATEQWGLEVTERDLMGYLDLLSERVDGHAGLLFQIGNHSTESSLSPSMERELREQAQAVHLMVEACRDRVLQFFDVLWQFVASHTEGQGDYERRLSLTAAARTQPGWRDVGLSWENLSLALENIASGLKRLYIMMEPLSDANILDYESLMVELSSSIQRSEELNRGINSIIAQQGEGNICWASLRERGDRLSLHAAPLHVGPILEDCLFSQRECVVLTSATLSIEGNFEYIKERLGLKEASELLLGSSFDYMSAAMVYIPQEIPQPDEPGYQQAVQQALMDVCHATQGRAMALFTSHAALRASHQAIAATLQGEGILVLGQGIDGTPKQLLETFKTHPKTVLLGTSSFWEGVDVVGEALSVLIMARLPFSVPNDPVFAARSQLFDDPFNQYAVPQAVLRFKQGFGRLIRTKSDRGVMVVLDRRIKSRFYGNAFLGSLPLCTVKSGPLRHLAGEVSTWLEGT